MTKLANHVISEKIITGKSKGTQIYIPHMSMSPSQSPWPFKLIRRQFLIMLSYAMTINESQGQSLDCVGCICQHQFLVTVNYMLQLLELKASRD